MSRSGAGNWLDRGAPPDEKVQQLLAHYLETPDALESDDKAWLVTAATEAIGMVLSDANELQLGVYLRRVAEARGRSGDELRGARVFAIAIFHVVKAADYRDRLKRARRSNQ